MNAPALARIPSIWYCKVVIESNMDQAMEGFEMRLAHKALVDEISRLPLEKIGKALSYVRFLEREQESALIIDDVEEAELLTTLYHGEKIDSAQMLTDIEALPDDSL